MDGPLWLPAILDLAHMFSVESLSSRSDLFEENSTVLKVSRAEEYSRVNSTAVNSTSVILLYPFHLPQGLTATGWVARASPAGGTTIIRVRTEPRLVPTQSVGYAHGSATGT